MLKQSLQQKLQQKLSPQQIQLMKLLQIPTIALDQRIKQEMEENMALVEGSEEDEFDGENNDEQIDDDFNENDDNNDDEFDLSDYVDPDDLPDYKYEANNKSKDDEERILPFASGNSFHDSLITQLSYRNITENQKLIATYIIGNIDDLGYLRRETIAIVDDLAFSQNIITNKNEVEEMINLIQTFDPPGVCARDLQECLLLQIKKLEQTQEVDFAHKILSKYFDAFTKKHYDYIISKLNIDNEMLKSAVSIITKLNPKPGNSINDNTKPNEQIIPDFVIVHQDNEMLLQINGKNSPELKISKTYRDMLETYSEQKENNNKQMKEAISFVKQKIDSAKWFIDAIKQRQNTLFNTMFAIMEYQFQYFQTGDETKLRPMILKDIADRVNLDISTVSRVVNSKYVQTPFGTFKLKTFFSESMQTQAGEEVSTREIKKILQNIIDSESKTKPCTDEKLTELLKEQGYNIARRTIAKYREQLSIPAARLRKEL